MRTAFALLCVLAIAGCQFKAKWHDTTSQERTQEQAQVDAKKCYDVSGYASLNKNSTNAEFEAFKTKLDACMAERGWELIRDDS